MKKYHAIAYLRAAYYKILKKERVAQYVARSNELEARKLHTKLFDISGHIATVKGKYVKTFNQNRDVRVERRFFGDVVTELVPGLMTSTLVLEVGKGILINHNDLLMKSLMVDFSDDESKRGVHIEIFVTNIEVEFDEMYRIVLTGDQRNAADSSQH